MTLLQLGAFAAALALYPGFLAAALTGLAAERGARRLTRSQSGPGSAGAPLLLAAVFLALAAAEVGAPGSPFPAEGRNALVALMALVAAGWAVWSAGGSQVHSALLLRAHLCLLVAVLVPAVVPQTLHPGALGLRSLAGHLPVKFAAGLLYLACLPVLLRLAPGTEPGLGRLDRGVAALAWLPVTGLFATLFFPPPGEGPVGGLVFLAAALGAAVAAVVEARLLVAVGPAGGLRVYEWVVTPFAWLTVGLGMLAAVIGPT